MVHVYAGAKLQKNDSRDSGIVTFSYTAVLQCHYGIPMTTGSCTVSVPRARYRYTCARGVGINVYRKLLQDHACIAWNTACVSRDAYTVQLPVHFKQYGIRARVLLEYSTRVHMYLQHVPVRENTCTNYFISVSFMRKTRMHADDKMHVTRV